MLARSLPRVSIKPAFTKYPASHIISGVMDQPTDNTAQSDADAYYGEDDAGTEELDLSFLDQDEDDADKTDEKHE